MNKEHVLGVYRTKLNHIKLAYASAFLWSYPDIPRVFKELHREILKNDGIRGRYPLNNKGTLPFESNKGK